MDQPHLTIASYPISIEWQYLSFLLYPHNSNPNPANVAALLKQKDSSAKFSGNSLRSQIIIYIKIIIIYIYIRGGEKGEK
jgi:hypothetical protein